MSAKKRVSNGWKNWALGILVILVIVALYVSFVQKDVRLAPPAGFEDIEERKQNIESSYADLKESFDDLLADYSDCISEYREIANNPPAESAELSEEGNNEAMNAWYSSLSSKDQECIDIYDDIQGLQLECGDLAESALLLHGDAGTIYNEIYHGVPDVDLEKKAAHDYLAEFQEVDSLISQLGSGIICASMNVLEPCLAFSVGGPHYIEDDEDVNTEETPVSEEENPETP